MSKAKTASKNNPTSREKSKEYFYNDKKVDPVLYVNGKNKFMAAAYADNGMPVQDKAGNVLAWAKITSTAPAS